MSRYQFSHADRSKGGKNQPRAVKVEAGRKGFEVTCERYGYMARKWLKHAPGMKGYVRDKFSPHKRETEEGV